MPWKSKQQAKWGHTEAGKKALGGESAVEEWDSATKGKKLPQKVEKSELAPVVKDPSKVGKQNVTVKLPKLKKPAGAFDKPSVFFGKNEDFQGPKHPTLRNLWDFLNKKHKK